MATDGSNASTPYHEVTNSTGRTFRVGEDPRQILGYPRGVIIWSAWPCTCVAGLLEYTWPALSGSLQAAHHWGAAPTFWLFSFFVVLSPSSRSAPATCATAASCRSAGPRSPAG